MVTSGEARGPWSLNSGKPDIEELQAARPLWSNRDRSPLAWPFTTGVMSMTGRFARQKRPFALSPLQPEQIAWISQMLEWTVPFYPNQLRKRCALLREPHATDEFLNRGSARSLSSEGQAAARRANVIARRTPC